MADSEIPLADWRGQPIEVGTRVIWRQGTTFGGTWAIGRITAIRPEEYGSGFVLDAKWERTSDPWRGSRPARGLKDYNVTVWPEQG
jgi:hypothetical protein